MEQYNSPPLSTIACRRHRRVMVIDDDIAYARARGIRLSMMGHAVHVETSGIAAVIAAETYRPEVVLLDIAMPGMSGFGVASRLRRAAWGQSIVLAAMTDSAEPLLCRRLIDFRFDACLPRAASDDELRSVLGIERNVG